MSLDVYLMGEEREEECHYCGCVLKNPEELYTANITHNLVRMAGAAGIYDALWRPDEHELTTAHQLVPLLTAGLVALEADEERFSEMNPDNGWGDYHGLVRFTRNYLHACKENPDAKVVVSR